MIKPSITKISNKYFFIPVVVLPCVCALLSKYYNPVALIIMLFGIAITIPFVRQLPHNLLKTLSYLILGVSAYTLVGLAYRGSYTTDHPEYMFIEFFPVLIFAIANAIAILITTEDKDTRGYTFAGMGCTVLFSSGLFGMGKQYGTLLLVMFVLWSGIPLILCRIFSKQIFPTTTIFRRIGRSVFGLLATFPIYLIIVLLSVFFIINQLSVSPETASLSIDFSGIMESLQGSNLVILGVLWYYFLPHLIFIPGAYMAYQLIFYDALGYEKHIERKTKEIIYTPPEKKSKKEKMEEEVDPYQGLFDELKNQTTAFKNITNRVGAYQLMQRFKNEYDTLHAKHGDTATGDKVKDTLRSIEEKFRAQFK